MPFVFRALVIALLGIAAGATEAAENRNRLWPVVRTCASAYRMIGVAFPCLEVELPGGALDRGFAVLRPFDSNDLILSPTRQVVGVEDPFLQSPDAPNYFAAAWGARAFLKGADGAPPPRDRVGLIVNSRSARSQDQLHIHIGCLRPGVRRALADAAPRMPLYEWTRVGPIAPRQVYYGVRVKERDLENLNPFRIAAHGFAGAAENPGRLMVMTAGARVKDDDDVLILAYLEAPSGARPLSGAESFLDRTCTAASPFG